nr:MAG TPA: hypothetical protein [Caudoviricetes sp.]
MEEEITARPHRARPTDPPCCPNDGWPYKLHPKEKET